MASEKLVCPFCGRGFYRIWKQLAIHVRVSHKDKAAQS